MTKYAWTTAEICALELVEHLLEATGGEDPACVYETVEEAGLDVEA